ncbi:MAG: GNAT family N-acetyltransferase [Clostridia bacterium]|nr:GNAT family N-acetyltransferase [Clostridia bacterium]
MIIRRAAAQDIAAISDLLSQVLTVHHAGRPDLFKANAVKYKPEELLALLSDESRPIFVAELEGVVKGYAFCMLQQHQNDNILTDIKTLYIDDLCVDENCRGKHIGKALYEFVLAYAKTIGCYNVTLNVWQLNESARKFYEACGLSVQKVGMEQIL